MSRNTFYTTKFNYSRIKTSTKYFNSPSFVSLIIPYKQSKYVECLKTFFFFSASIIYFFIVLLAFFIDFINVVASSTIYSVLPGGA